MSRFRYLSIGFWFQPLNWGFQFWSYSDSVGFDFGPFRFVAGL